MTTPRLAVIATCLASTLVSASPRATPPTDAPLAARQATPLTDAALAARLDAFIPTAMDRLRVVPGLSIAVVRGDRVVYARGFGLADVGTKRPVEPDTPFYIASLAKTFTGMTAAVLVDEGRLDLDAPLAGIFPGFVPPDGADPAKATVRGLLAHDPGFGNSTVNYVTSFVRPYESDAALVHVLNTYSVPLKAFTYANTNYALMARVIEKAAGRPWQDVMRDLVFAPLGMTHTRTTLRDAADLAQPYAAEAEGFVLMPLQKTDRTVTGAGGFVTTAGDLARFVRASLHGGRLDGRQALPDAAVRQAQAPLVPLDATYTYYHRTGYGFGLYLGDDDGEPMPHHFGSITGYKSHLSFMPRLDAGVVVLQNEGADGSRFSDLVASYAYDLLLGRDADERAAARIEDYATRIERARAQRAGPRAEWTKWESSPATPALPLPAYAGRYRSDRLGDLDLTVRGHALVISFGDLGGDAVPIGGHEFLVSWRDGGPPDRWQFQAGDTVTGFDWGGRAFARVR